MNYILREIIMSLGILLLNGSRNTVVGIALQGQINNDSAVVQFFGYRFSFQPEQWRRVAQIIDGEVVIMSLKIYL